MRIELEIQDETNRTSVKQVIDTNTRNSLFGLDLQFYESEQEPGLFKLKWDSGNQCQAWIILSSDEVEELKKVLSTHVNDRT